jgi:hypothetical protein
MTIAVLDIEPTASSFTDSGQSREAMDLADEATWYAKRLEDRVIYVDRYRVALRELESVASESLEQDWDGYGAKEVDFHSFVNAVKFIKVLPMSLLNLEIGIDPDGEISLDWYGEGNSSVTISIGPNDELTFAARFGQARVHGVEFFEDEIPRAILELLSRLK